METPLKFVIPAAPGYSVIAAYPPDSPNEEWTVVYHPVVAWGIPEEKFERQDGSSIYQYWLEPIAIDCRYPQDKPIRQPTGEIVLQQDQSWGSLEDYLAYLKQGAGK